MVVEICHDDFIVAINGSKMWTLIKNKMNKILEAKI